MEDTVFGKEMFFSSRDKKPEIREEINISFSDSVRGCNRKYTYKVYGKCDECLRTGAYVQDSRNSYGPCDLCKGKGKRIPSLRKFFGIFCRKTPCKNCKGEGWGEFQSVYKKCEKCLGNGCALNEKTINIKIPPGIESGKTLRFLDSD